MTDHTTDEHDGYHEAVDHHDEVRAALNAAINGHKNAVEAAGYWRITAYTLTSIRCGGHLPHLPLSEEEWWEHARPAFPFGSDELARDLDALSALITKAHTLAVVYSDSAARLLRMIEQLTEELTAKSAPSE
ncbi:hypothetical protein NDR87_31565 [Nocardia sp. CDC159]|uniref:Uncharacterized protein n=1 Tax=Nocardia pulmonis TaxID=2951408 RepID=A0A9X2J2D2_9NOCA|nr:MULTISPECIES: hypothetical protein [Nocardia]MCM6777911.1 hypothetical protein [Nocardia pulmonis]MCM6790918.1 hypothetical protein [Nocardia sp. CDC159]